MREYDRVQRRNQGIPWVNSIAADSRGEAYYADIGAVPNVSNAKAQACNTPLGTQTTQLLGIPILDGSRTACRWDNDPDALQPGSFGPKNMPSMFRRDYVTNSNDSYWLSNPAQRLEGFARIIGDERAVRSLRTRLGLRIVQQRLDGSDGLPGRRFTLRQVQDAVFNNRQYAGELFRDRLVSICKAEPVMQGTQGPVDVREACPILEAWNLRDDLDSRGAVLFRRFATKLLALPGPLGQRRQQPGGLRAAVRRERPGEHAARPEQQPGHAHRTRRRREGAARQRNPAQRAPARVPVRGCAAASACRSTAGRARSACSTRSPRRSRGGRASPT